MSNVIKVKNKIVQINLRKGNEQQTGYCRKFTLVKLKKSF